MDSAIWICPALWSLLLSIHSIFMNHRQATNPAGPVTPEQAHTNALIHETSPYLLQHAHNPVDWRAWGSAAFEVARREDKPIFLSVGYSTCYWCHVMERESFEDPATAAALNARFICIKLDREERPDVDDVYMAATQAMTGSGGWPMSVFLEPHTLKPFYAGTYFPREPAFGRPSFTQLLTAIDDAWKLRRDDVLAQSEQVADAVRAQLASARSVRAVGEQHVERAVDALMSIYDREHGGFGGAPKFPQPVYLELLIGAAWDREDTRHAVRHTVNRMAMGGMYDQVGGGFHRYSVDERWIVPHFEKMLYDNGQLVSLYAEVFARTSDPFYADVVKRTLAYVEREMIDERGGFFSAQDAEVDAREGLNYLWTADEFRRVLRDGGASDADISLAMQIFGLEGEPNFRDPHHPEDGWKYVLVLADTPASIAARLNMQAAELDAKLSRLRSMLLDARRRRPSPGTDDKILCGWNGLMIAGFADAARVLNEPRYASVAERAAEFILGNMQADDGSLLRTWRDGRAKVPAFLEDYAMLVRGLIALHRATGERRWLDECRNLVLQSEERFANNDTGGYFDTLADQADLFVRTRSTHDGAVPSGNSVMLLNLLDLFELTSDESYLNSATIVLRGMSSPIAENPVGPALATLALHRFATRWPDRLPTEEDGERRALAPVTVTPGAGSVELHRGRVASLDVFLDIAPGWHVIAHEPGDVRLAGLKLELINGDGLRLSAEYPAGDLLDGSIRAYHGRITIPVRIEQVGDVPGRPSIVVTYQPCTQTECLKPVVARLDVAVHAEHAHSR